MRRNRNSEPKEEVGQILNMQHLLDEYDRENRYLNKQVLQLLAENKALKINKVRQDSLKRLKDIRDKPQRTTDILGRLSDNDIVARWKQEKKSLVNSGVKPVQRKDEGVQVQSIESLSQQKIEGKLRQDSQKQVGSEVFSFGNNTQRSSKERIEAQTSTGTNLNTLSKPMSPEKERSTGEKEGQNKMRQSPIVQVKAAYTEPAEEKERHGINQASRHSGTPQKSQVRRRGRSNHAINPSPRIMASSSEKKMGVGVAGSRQGTFIKLASNQCLQRFESQERKRFIDVVSRGEASIRPNQISKKPSGCC